MTNTHLRPPADSARRRVDAQRNRDKILAAAQTAFADPDADVSMAEIARRAGIGSATLYRNFSDRRTLLEALYSEQNEVICQAAATSEGVTAIERLQAWLRRFYGYLSSKRVLAGELLEHTHSDNPVFSTGYARIITAADPLFEAARASGELRNDLALDQILALIGSIANIAGNPSYRQPILDAALDALRSSGSIP